MALQQTVEYRPVESHRITRPSSRRTSGLRLTLPYLWFGSLPPAGPLPAGIWVAS